MCRCIYIYVCICILCVDVHGFWWLRGKVSTGSPGLHLGVSFSALFWLELLE